ncbi:MAG: hypothetical protein NZ891_08140, partial [bacterium]|nr:hypothetical protein [bacterium]MDW8164689.1 hypothetical protein [Candidatus Omnitrophota bacterium]
RAYYQEHDLFGVGAENFNLVDHPLLVPELMGVCVPYRVLGLDLAGRSTYSDADNEYIYQITLIIEDTNIGGNFDPTTDLAFYSNAPYPNISLWRDSNNDGYFDPNNDQLIPISNPVRRIHAPITKINPNDPNDRRWKAVLQFDPNVVLLEKTADDKVDFFIVFTTEPSLGQYTKKPFYGADFKVYIDPEAPDPNGPNGKVGSGIIIRRVVGLPEDQPKSTYIDQQTGQEKPVSHYVINKNNVKDIRIGFDIKPFEWWNITRNPQTGEITNIEKHPVDGPIEADGVPIPVFLINMTDGWGQYGKDETLQWIRVWFKQTPENPFKPTWLMPLSDDENSGVSLWWDYKDVNNPARYNMSSAYGGDYLWGLPDSRIVSDSNMLLGVQKISISDTLIPLDTDSLEWYNSDGTKWSPTNDDPRNPEGSKRYFVVLKPKSPISLPDSDINPPASSGPGPRPVNTGDYPGRQSNYGHDLYICIKPRGVSIPQTAYRSTNWWERGIEFGKKINVAIGLTKNNDSNVYVNDNPWEDILFGSGHLARVFPDRNGDGVYEPIEHLTDRATIPTFFTNLTRLGQNINAFTKTAVIGVNLVAPNDGSSYTIDSMTLMVVDDNNPPTLDFGELVDPNSDPNDP